MEYKLFDELVKTLDGIDEDIQILIPVKLLRETLRDQNHGYPTNTPRIGYIFGIPSQHVKNVYCDFDHENGVIDIIQEECSELIKALSKFKRSKGSPMTSSPERSQVVEEVAHVLICCGLAAMKFEISSSEIREEVIKKAKEGGYDIGKYPPGYRSLYDD